MKTEQLFSLARTLAAPLLQHFEYPWEALSEIAAFICRLGPTLDPEKFDQVQEGVWVAKSARVFASAYLAAPCIIDEDAEIRQGAFVRGSALIGKHTVVGNSTEVKNSIVFDHVQIPHFNYVGDSILGYYAHLGAGAICSNVKSDKSEVTVRTPQGKISTGLKKFGAMVGDHTEVGCNSVLCPGTVLGPNCTVYPLSRVRGTVERDHIFKSEEVIVPKRSL